MNNRIKGQFIEQELKELIGTKNSKIESLKAIRLNPNHNKLTIKALESEHNISSEYPDKSATKRITYWHNLYQDGNVRSKMDSVKTWKYLDKNYVTMSVAEISSSILDTIAKLANEVEQAESELERVAEIVVAHNNLLNQIEAYNETILHSSRAKISNIH